MLKRKLRRFVLWGLNKNQKKMEKFEKYLEKIREDVKRTPNSEMERGFQTAVILIYEHYKKEKSKIQNN